jgi:hypothetical protein
MDIRTLSGLEARSRSQRSWLLAGICPPSLVASSRDDDAFKDGKGTEVLKINEELPRELSISGLIFPAALRLQPAI